MAKSTVPREAGYYWLKIGDDSWTIGIYEPINGDGSRNNYPWQTVGDDRIYEDKDFTEIGARIERAQ